MGSTSDVPPPEPVPPADGDISPPEPNIPTPPSPDAYVDPYADCDATDLDWPNREDGCDLERTCESGATQYVACTRIEDETWRCSCRDFDGEKVVQLSATDGPCELVGAACPTLQMPRFDGDPECRDSGSSSANACEFGSDCVRTAPIDEAFTAVEIVSSAKVVCSSASEGTYSCGCLGSPGKGVMQIDANRVQLSDVCGLLMPGCTEDEDPRFEPWSCTQRSEELTEEGCRLVQDCTREGMPGDVPVTVHDTALVSCVPSDAGGALCRCATNFFGSA
ncbi:MAG: hypothetical protein JW940_04415, partial [Polyangiaceae bacterium]|nr:hypothetical protein [Polyangiaceae bacterium]